MYMCNLKSNYLSMLSFWEGDSLSTFLLKEEIRSKPYSHSPRLNVSFPFPSLLPGQHRSRVSTTFLVPDISFIFWLALLFIKTCNSYISSSIPRYFIAIIFFKISKLSTLGRFCVKVSCVYIVFIQTPKTVFLAGLVTPFSFLPLCFCGPTSRGEMSCNDGRSQLILPRRD